MTKLFGNFVRHTYQMLCTLYRLLLKKNRERTREQQNGTDGESKREEKNVIVWVDVFQSEKQMRSFFAHVYFQYSSSSSLDRLWFSFFYFKFFLSVPSYHSVLKLSHRKFHCRLLFSYALSQFHSSSLCSSVSLSFDSQSHFLCFSFSFSFSLSPFLDDFCRNF